MNFFLLQFLVCRWPSCSSQKLCYWHNTLFVPSSCALEQPLLYLALTILHCAATSTRPARHTMGAPRRGSMILGGHSLFLAIRWRVDVLVHHNFFHVTDLDVVYSSLWCKAPCIFPPGIRWMEEGKRADSCVLHESWVKEETRWISQEVSFWREFRGISQCLSLVLEHSSSYGIIWITRKYLVGWLFHG